MECLDGRCLAALVATLDAALELRVCLHEERLAKRLTVQQYMSGLGAVRDVEDVLEPLRGADHSRAYQLSIDG